jgi:hypothetical protein
LPRKTFVGKYLSTFDVLFTIFVLVTPRWVYERSGWKAVQTYKERSKLGSNPHKPFVPE